MYLQVHLEHRVRISEGVTLCLHHTGIVTAVPENRFQVEANGARAEDRAVNGIVAADHPTTAGCLLETNAAELLVLAMEEGLILEELYELGVVERLIDLADAKLRGSRADECQDVRVFRLQRVVRGAIELDERLELAPARRQRHLGIARRPWREPVHDVIEALGAEVG